MPTPALLHVLVAGGVLHELGRLTGSSWLALASAALLALPLVALVARPRLDGLVVQRRASARAVAGRPSPVVYALHNAGRRTTSAAMLHCAQPGHEHAHVGVPALRPGEQVEVEVLLEVTRASGPAQPVVLLATSPLGLLRVRRAQPLAGQVVVHPAERPALRLPEVAGPSRSSRLARPAPGRGSEVLGLRERRPGDPASSVAARASARHGRPLVLEREREQAAAPLVVLVLPGRGPAWEDALAVAARTAVQALRSGQPPVLLGLPGLPAGRLPASAVLDAFAAADLPVPVEAGPLAAALRAAGPGAAVLVVDDPVAGDPGLRLLVRRTAAQTGTRLVVLGG